MCEDAQGYLSCTPATPATYSNLAYTCSPLDRSHDVIELSLLPSRNYTRASFINNGKIHKLTRYHPSNVNK